MATFTNPFTGQTSTVRDESESTFTQPVSETDPDKATSSLTSPTDVGSPELTFARRTRRKSTRRTTGREEAPVTPAPSISTTPEITIRPEPIRSREETRTINPDLSEFSIRDDDALRQNMNFAPTLQTGQSIGLAERFVSKAASSDTAPIVEKTARFLSPAISFTEDVGQGVGIISTGIIGSPAAKDPKKLTAEEKRSVGVATFTAGAGVSAAFLPPLALAGAGTVFAAKEIVEAGREPTPEQIGEAFFVSLPLIPAARSFAPRPKPKISGRGQGITETVITPEGAIEGISTQELTVTQGKNVFEVQAEGIIDVVRQSNADDFTAVVKSFATTGERVSLSRADITGTIAEGSTRFSGTTFSQELGRKGGSRGFIQGVSRADDLSFSIAGEVPSAPPPKGLNVFNIESVVSGRQPANIPIETGFKTRSSTISQGFSTRDDLGSAFIDVATEGVSVVGRRTTAQDLNILSSEEIVFGPDFLTVTKSRSTGSRNTGRSRIIEDVFTPTPLVEATITEPTVFNRGSSSNVRVGGFNQQSLLEFQKQAITPSLTASVDLAAINLFRSPRARVIPRSLPLTFLPQTQPQSIRQDLRGVQTPKQSQEILTIQDPLVDFEPVTIQDAVTDLATDTRQSSRTKQILDLGQSVGQIVAQTPAIAVPLVAVPFRPLSGSFGIPQGSRGSKGRGKGKTKRVKKRRTATLFTFEDPGALFEEVSQLSGLFPRQGPDF